VRNDAGMMPQEERDTGRLFVEEESGGGQAMEGSSNASHGIQEPAAAGKQHRIEESERFEEGEEGEEMLVHGFASWCPMQLDREVRLGGWYVTDVVNASVILRMPREVRWDPKPPPPLPHADPHAWSRKSSFRASSRCNSNACIFFGLRALSLVSALRWAS